MTESASGGVAEGGAAPALRATVPAEWIDYNGHMNVAYYTMAFDRAVDVLFEERLGIGESFVKAARMGPYALQAQVCYLAELLEGDDFEIDARIVDADAKRLHLFLEMRRARDGARVATQEIVLINVDLETRRSAPYSAEAQARIAAMAAAHADLPPPPELGRALGLARRG